jgi:hypothetical protein
MFGNYVAGTLDNELLDLSALLFAAACALAVLWSSQAFGRIAGISTAAACGASLVFFAMEPVFSFEIASPADRGTIIAYGIATFLMVLRQPRRDAARLEHVAWQSGASRKSLETEFVQLLEAAAAQVWPAGVAIDIDPRMRVPGSGDELEQVLDTIMRARVPDLVPVRIAAYSGTAPGHCLIWVALQYKQWPAEPHIVRSGRRADLCEHLETPNHGVCSVSWFDNGFERVFQISAPWIS